MRPLERTLLILVAAVTALAACATPYQRFARPDGDLTFEYPSGWSRSPGLMTVRFFHPEEKEVVVSVGTYPLNKDEPGTSNEYLSTTIQDIGLYGGHLNRKEVIQVSGRYATRLEYTEKHGIFGQASGIEIVIPDGAKYYVMSLLGKAADVAIIRPEFDRMISSLRLGPAPKSLMEWDGAYGGPEEATRMIASTPEELRRVISVFGLDSVGKVIPDSGFDFRTYMLVAIGMGRQPTGGYSVTIKDVVQRDNVLYVRYRERAPRPGAYVTQAVTAPFCIKVLPRGDAGRVLFERVAEPETPGR